MNQVSVAGMDLNKIEPDGLATLDGIDEGLLHFRYFLRGHSLGLRILLGEGNITSTPDYFSRKALQSHTLLQRPKNYHAPSSGHPFSSFPAVWLAVKGTPRGSAATQGEYVLAFLPACASWMPIFAPFACTKLTIRWRGAICSSPHMPLSSGEIRPSGRTAVASMVMAPDPRVAKPLRCRNG